ncbi:MAG: hypothetical protein R3B13_14770 [Polyangiaceae bacterium]
MNRMTLGAPILGLLAALLACRSSKKDACATDRDCLNGTICSSGRCVEPSAAGLAAPAPVPNAAPAPTGRATGNGDPSLFPFGYYDISGRNQRADFCQVVRATSTIECDTGAQIIRSIPNVDLGHPRTGRMEDANGDGRDDFCRCVGDSPQVFYSCMTSTGNGFSPVQYGLRPPNRTTCDYLNAQQAAAQPLPAAPPPPPPPVAAAPTDECGGRCNFVGTACSSGSCRLARDQEWAIAPIALRIYEGRSCGGPCRARICISARDGTDKHCSQTIDFHKGTSDGRGRFKVGVNPISDATKVVSTEDLLQNGFSVEFWDGARLVERFPVVGRFDGVTASKLLFDGGLVLRLQGHIFYSMTIKLEHHVTGD